MATWSETELVRVDCGFSWEQCVTRMGASHISQQHVCKSGIEHTGLHHCAHCGTVHLVKRVGIEYSPLYMEPSQVLTPTHHQPHRDDAVARWLKAKRDKAGAAQHEYAYHIIDWLLDDYREHADTGTPLDATVERGKM